MALCSSSAARRALIAMVCSAAAITTDSWWQVHPCSKVTKVGSSGDGVALVTARTGGWLPDDAALAVNIVPGSTDSSGGQPPRQCDRAQTAGRYPSQMPQYVGHEDHKVGHTDTSG